MKDIFSSQSPMILIGCGNMGRAMAAGWLEAGLMPEALLIVDPGADKEGLPGVSPANYFANIEALPASVKPQAVVLAVKPQMIDSVLPLLSGRVVAETLVISVAAGVSLDRLKEGIGSDAVYIRAMPNTPAAVGAGITGLTGYAGIDEGDKTLACRLLEATGEAVWIEDEALMNAVTGVSGSGPAYIFHMAEAMAAAGTAQGLDPEVSMKLARQTIIGAARLMEKQPDTSAASLREMVTSPGGTTAAALAVLMQDEGLSSLMTQAIAAATKRGEELAG